MRSQISAFVLFALGIGSAQADPSAFYFGAGATRASLGNFGAYINPEDVRGYDINDVTSWKALAGFRPINPFAIEVDYLGRLSRTLTFGTGNAYPTREHASAVAVYGVGLLPLGKLPVEIFAKAGVNSWKLDASGYGDVLTTAGPISKSGTGLAWGIGLQTDVGRVGARIEYEKLDIARTGGLKVVSLSVTLSFPGPRL